MIIKIKAIKSPDFERLIRYILPKRYHRGKQHSMFIFKHNLKGNRVEDWVRQFEENESFRIHKRAGNTILTHEIISFNAEDSPYIDVEMMRDFTKKYIEYRGLRGMYIAVPHFDTDNFHIHLCCSGVEYRMGKAMRLSRKEFQNLKIRMQEYQMQKYPQLQHSIVRHGRGKAPQKDREYQAQKRSGQVSKRTQIKDQVRDISLRANSSDEFINSLENQELKPYYRGGKLTGVISGKRKYRFKTLGVRDEIERIFEREKRRNLEREINR